ncbi:MAG: hypothetical protein KKE44_00310 [Proteobacteria bacterium]|nr:hypothetical protein [Pseudomonadota bacterium]MBU1581169.1 hypothetical protein [Pseudomonadota bacterium]MBU2454588.1 hypothetical protein [Pseudomonadota bacterium]MBU2628393.1 hypothetical protein [Pseudomonadota bacterium]
MEIKQDTSNIENCFSRYEELQVRHLAVMESENLPDLDLMTRERETVFHLLKTALESFMETAGTQYGTDSLSVLSRYEDRLASMMKLDDKIAIEIKRHRDSLKVNLNLMKKGKAAMNGYRRAGTNSKNPRVLSMNR